MAARNRPGLSEATRKRIKTTMIVKRLMDHIVAEGDLMTKSQVTAAQVLLRKTLPDLSSIDMAAEIDTTLTIVRKEYKPSKS